MLATRRKMLVASAAATGVVIRVLGRLAHGGGGYHLAVVALERFLARVGYVSGACLFYISKVQSKSAPFRGFDKE